MKHWNDKIIEEIRKGYFTAVYFNRTKYILEQEKNDKTVTMQIFQKNEGSVLCGVEEIKELLKVGVGYYEGGNTLPLKVRGGGGVMNWIDKSKELEIKSLKDGDRIGSWETVMHIIGPYLYFAHLESLYLGILARRTLVASNVRRAVEAANGKPVLFFADRFDHFLNQEGDGYAAYIGGAAGVCTKAHTKWWGGIPSGTIPHSLIAVNSGDTTISAKLFNKYFPEEKLIVLVDFENDCVKTSLQVAKSSGSKLWGVRLDTAGNLIDKSVGNAPQPPLKVRGGAGELYGVNPTLVKLVRSALDKEGYKNVKIVVSGGFDAEKIKLFESQNTPVDVYGVGSSLLKGNSDFTADIVKVEDKLISKVGRTYFENKRMKIINI